MSSVQKKFLKTVKKNELKIILANENLSVLGRAHVLRERLLAYWINAPAFEPTGYSTWLVNAQATGPPTPDPKQCLADYFTNPSDDDDDLVTTTTSSIIVTTSSTAVTTAATGTNVGGLPTLTVTTPSSGTPITSTLPANFALDLSNALLQAVRASQSAANPPPLKKTETLKEMRQFRQEAKTKNIKFYGKADEDHLVDICRKEETLLAKKSKYVPPPAQLVNANNSDEDDVEESSKNSNAQTSNAQISAVQGNFNSRPRQNRQNRLVCYNCSEPGHSFYECRMPPTIFCYNCGKKGSYTTDIHDCPRRNRSRNSSSSSRRDSRGRRSSSAESASSNRSASPHRRHVSISTRDQEN